MFLSMNTFSLSEVIINQQHLITSTPQNSGPNLILYRQEQKQSAVRSDDVHVQSLLIRY